MFALHRSARRSIASKWIALALLGVSIREAAAAPLPTLRPDELHAGQHAIVKTVFEGFKIETFEAEIVGVFRGGRTEGDLILARATAGKALQSGIALGMSGSPMYVDGKLVGALSGLWPFSREPIFGVTPIGEMLEVLDQPDASSPEETAGPTGIDPSAASGGLGFGELRWEDAPREPVSEHRPAPAATSSIAAVPEGMVRTMIPLACGGLQPAALDYARAWLEPLGFAAVPGGRSATGGPPASALEPGAAVAIDVMRGDLQLSAIGTVTWRDGDRVLIFGHPLFQSGNVRLPLATAEIATIIANQQASFKLGSRGQTIGTVTQDRRPAVGGTLGASPRLLPLAVDLDRGRSGKQSFRFESIEDRSLAPSLIATATLNSLLESGGTASSQTLRWTLRLSRPGARPLVLSDVVSSESPPTDLANAIASPLRFLFNNPYRRLTLDSVSVAIAVETGREQWTLRGVRVLDAAVRPGGRVRLDAELERWRGGREVREITLRIPEEVPDGQYTLWVGGGAELTRYEASHLPGRFRPVSLDDAWKRLDSFRPSESLYAALFARAPEVTSDGKDYPELPISAVALMSSELSTGDRVRRGDLARLDETRLPLAGVTRGEMQVQITVDSRAP